MDVIKTYGDNVILYLANKPFLLISEPIWMERIMGSNKLIDKSEDYRFFVRWFGDGLLTSTGSKWRSRRKILTPSFHYKILEEFVEVFDEASKILVDNLKKETGKDTFEVYPYISSCTLDIICETAMGTSVNAQKDPDSLYVKSTKTMCDITYIRFFSIYLRFDFIYYLSRTYRREKRAIKVLRDFTNGVIKKRREALLHLNQNETVEVDEFGVKRKHTFLDVLLKATVNGKPLNDSEIREEVDTFMFEGHDTTAIAISFALYSLSKHPEIQSKVYNELHGIFGNDKEKPATYENLQDMKYLELVIKETLRLYPSVAAFGREIMEDEEHDGQILPKGLSLFFFVYGMHRNAKFFPDPEKFVPERFTAENQTARHPFSYVPFSAGPRNCIGQKFAMLELKSTISKVLRHYEILPAIPEHTIEVISRVTIQSATGIKIRLIERK